uniref:Putative alpha terpinol/1,8-cineole synthase n=1 Tax=Pinus nigra subsp. laricio TaxID=658419 RepID=A0A6C0W2Y2_9CONI|nr:putative alpha terpinol/1,8-cineole synthase [Pinus nigra subsp. laricio]
MALLSVAPLHKPFTTSGHHPSSTTMPTLPVCTPRKTVTPSIIMCLTAAVSDAAATRRIANHHSNLWADDFIHSLSTHYEAPSYRERAERLIKEVKEMFTEIEDGLSITPLSDLLSRLSMVDSIERLGIDRHFKMEIESALDYVHSYWTEKGIGCGRESGVTDLNSTALGLRTLRLHGYPVSSSVLEQFKAEKGQFATSSIQTDQGEIRTIFNLFRASLVAFPNEKVMEQAQIFSTIYLKEYLEKIPLSSLSRQIEYVMEYGWHTTLPRLEARHYMDVFGYNEMPWMSYVNIEKLLELAKLEFNIFHSIQQRELKHISRWWKDSGFSQMNFVRHRHVEYYTLASCFAIDPEHSAFRVSFAKMCHLVTVLDDIYDTFGTMEELQLFTAAVKRWDPSATDSLPEYMKRVYTVLYETVNEMAQVAKKTQGRDTINYARHAWEAYLDSYMKEAEWISTGCLPTFEEYYENGKISFGYRISMLQPTLSMDIPFPHHILQEIDYPSRFSSLAAGILRLKGDTRCYQADSARGEEASCISCYMKENPGLTGEDVVNHIHVMVDDLIKELNWELLKPDCNAPISSKKHGYDICRAVHHGYKYRDGYSVATNEIKDLVMITVLEPVPL